MKNTKKALLMTSLITSALVVTACGTTENKEDTKSTNTQSQTQGIAVGEYNPSAPENTKKSEPIPSDVKIMEKETDKKHSTEKTTPSSLSEEKKPVPTSKVTQKEEVQDIDLFDVKEEKNYKADFHSGWKKAPSSLQEVTIDGRGEGAIEEGYASLVVKNTKTNESKLYSVKGAEKVQLTPKYVEWIDDNRLYVIVGFPYGTVTKGGELYELNLTNDKVTAVINNLKDNEEIVSIKQNQDGTFTYQKHIYEDENFTVGHFETGTLPVSVTK